MFSPAYWRLTDPRSVCWVRHFPRTLYRLICGQVAHQHPQSGDPAKRARAIVQAVTHYNNPKVLAEVSENLGAAMVGLTM